jgi:hypothetical protein
VKVYQEGIENLSESGSFSELKRNKNKRWKPQKNISSPLRTIGTCK